MKRMAHITDLHLNEPFPKEKGYDPLERWKKIIADVAEKKITEIILGGDIGAPEVYGWFFDSLKQFTIHVTPGNHDQSTEILKFYLKESIGINEVCSSHDEGGFRLIFLDSSRDRISEEQWSWLQQQLETDRKILLFLHHPVLPVNTAVDRKYPLSGREEISKVLKAVNNQVTIFCGHYHLADGSSDGNIRQYISPAASFQIRRNPEKIEFDTGNFGYRIITLYGNMVETEVLMYKEGIFKPDKG